MQQLASLWRERPHLLCAGIISVTIALRLWFIASGQLDLVQDEAQYWDWSRRLQLSYYSKGPLIAWVIAFFTGIFGNTELGVRFGAVVGSLLAQLLLYYGLAHLMQRPRLAALTLFIANTTPLFMASGILMTTDNPLLVCWLAAFFCLHATVTKPGALWPWLGLSLAMALGILAKYTMLAMAGIALLHAFGLHRQGLLPQGHLRRLFGALGVGIAAGFAPIVIWNAQNDWVSFRHVGRLAGVAPAASEHPPLIRFDRFPEYFGSQLGLILPWWLGFMLVGAWHALKKGWLAPKADAAADPDSLRQNILFSSGFWPLWGFFLLWSFHTRIYANWSAMSYAAGLILAGACLESVLEKRWQERHGAKAPADSRDASTAFSLARRLAPAWVVLSMVLFIGIHAQQPLSRFLPDAYNPAARLKGWSDLGRQLERIRLSMPRPDKVFFFSDAYDVTAAIAFYIPGQPVTYCADFGRRLSQYDIWPGPEDKKGWDAVFVKRVAFKQPDTLLSAMFQRLGQPYAYESTHLGKPARTFGTLVLQGFTGDWPHLSKGIY